MIRYLSTCLDRHNTCREMDESPIEQTSLPKQHGPSILRKSDKKVKKTSDTQNDHSKIKRENKPGRENLLDDN